MPGPGQYNTDHLYPAVPASHNRRPRQKLRGKLKAEAKASYKAAMQRRRAKRRAALHALVAGASSPCVVRRVFRGDAAPMLSCG